MEEIEVRDGSGTGKSVSGSGTGKLMKLKIESNSHTKLRLQKTAYFMNIFAKEKYFVFQKPESVKFGFIQRSELFQTLTFVEID